MGIKIKKALKEAKAIPKAAWIAAVVIPGGLAAVAAYLFAKSLKKKPPYEEMSLKEFLKKEDK